MLVLPWMLLVAVAADSAPGDKKVAGVRAAREADARALLKRAGLGWPARGVLLRGFKGDRALELWATDGKSGYRLIKSYPICAVPGRLGPKRREGDMQVPEGIYRVIHFNPLSSYHLSMGIDYPNSSDRKFADPRRPGSNIYIHGNCVTIGCIPVGDAAIEELYLICQDAKNAGGAVNVHLFPCRAGSRECRAEMEARVREEPGLRQFWQDLDAVQAAFDRDRQLPKVKVDGRGRYVVE